MVNKFRKTKYGVAPSEIFSEKGIESFLFAMFLAGSNVVVPVLAPLAIITLLGIAEKNTLDKDKQKKIHNTISYARRAGYISVQKKKSGVSVKLTQKGKKKIQYYKTKVVHIPKRSKQWDGMWRIIMFDVPEGDRNKRDACRRWIQSIDAVLLQKSVWVYPFDCGDAIKELRTILGLSKRQLQLIVAKSLEDEKRLKKIFKI